MRRNQRNLALVWAGQLTASHAINPRVCRILSTQKRNPRRCTDRRGRIGLGKTPPHLGQAVEVGSFVHRISTYLVGGNILPSQIIHHDVYNVWLGCRKGSRSEKKNGNRDKLLTFMMNLGVIQKLGFSAKINLGFKASIHAVGL